jgi:hypothetical protein
MFTVEEKVLESLGWASGSSFYKALRAATGQQQQQQRATAGAAQQQQQEGGDSQMQDAPEEPHDLPSTEQQQELQQEAAAAAAIDAVKLSGAAAAADSMLRRTLQGVKRGSEAGSGGDPMDTEASRGSRSPSVLSGSAKRHRGADGKASDSARNSPAVATVPEEELPLPRALGTPPSSSNGGGGAAAAAAAGCDPAALLALHDYCRKVLKLAAFRLVAVR